MLENYKSVFVTGSRGFLGREIFAELSKSGIPVRGTDIKDSLGKHLDRRPLPVRIP